MLNVLRYANVTTLRIRRYVTHTPLRYAYTYVLFIYLTYLCTYVRTYLSICVISIRRTHIDIRTYVTRTYLLFFICTYYVCTHITIFYMYILRMYTPTFFIYLPCEAGQKADSVTKNHAIV